MVLLVTGSWRWVVGFFCISVFELARVCFARLGVLWNLIVLVFWVLYINWIIFWVVSYVLEFGFKWNSDLGWFYYKGLLLIFNINSGFVCKCEEVIRVFYVVEGENCFFRLFFWYFFFLGMLFENDGLWIFFFFNGEKSIRK